MNKLKNVLYYMNNIDKNGSWTECINDIENELETEIDTINYIIEVLKLWNGDTIDKIDIDNNNFFINQLIHYSNELIDKPLDNFKKINVGMLYNKMIYTNELYNAICDYESTNGYIDFTEQIKILKTESCNNEDIFYNNIKEINMACLKSDSNQIYSIRNITYKYNTNIEIINNETYEIINLKWYEFFKKFNCYKKKCYK